ncbi:MAG: DUF4912 domain-containing protein [Treponema sp.]|jgi:hypothetical protein|nr:DUF4912 domain-containing protein [Treponema sp.]
MGRLPLEQPLINRSYLERLSTEELIHLADYYGIDIPPDLERIFVIEQLIELADDDDEYEYGGESLENTSIAKTNLPGDASCGADDFPDQAVLPRQYNISYMDVIIRDPLWAFVFWELKSAEKESLEAEPDFGGYYLKVSSMENAEGFRAKNASFFTVQISNDDTAWYLGFSQDEEKDTKSFKRVDLCAQKGDSELILVSSKVFRLPALAPAKTEVQKEGTEGSLAFLSGIDNFPVLRNGDRQSRMKIRGDSFKK